MISSGKVKVFSKLRKRIALFLEAIDLETRSIIDAEAISVKMRGLIFGRLALIFVLLVASWWWTNTYLEFSVESFPTSLFILFIVSVLLTGIYLLAFRYNENLIWQVRIQLLIDVFLVTWLVSETADFNSPYVTLYIILVSTAGYFLDRSETLLFGILSAAFFTVASAIAGQSLLYSLGNGAQPSKYIQIIAFNTVGILIVGLLAGHLSDRRKVTERLKLTEESFEDLNVLHERILESIPSGLITTDLSGKIRTINRSAEEVTRNKADETLGTSVYLLFDDNIRPSVDLCLYRASNGSEFPTEHFEAQTRGGKNGNSGTATVVGSVAPLIGKTGMVNGLILTFMDVTEIRNMEKSLRQSDRLAVVGRMAAGLAHEIRNPLGSMSSALQYLDENVKPATPEANLMDVVLRESDRLNEIISNFLTYARLSAGGLPNEKFESVDLGKAIEDCVVLLRHSPEVDNKHVFDIDMPENPVSINANSAQIKQVFWNLFRNSIHSMPEGGKLTVGLKDAPGKKASIKVTDTGHGMETEKLEHLFEPFSSYSEGAGLGLSIVHKIVRDHGGTIDVISSVGAGTTVTVELPH